MSSNSKSSRFPNIGNLSIAILEHIVEPILGEKAIDEIKAPVLEKDLIESLSKALQNTEKRFVKENKDKQVNEAIINLPLANLPSIVQAVRNFYSQPNDPTFSQIVAAQLTANFPNISKSKIETSVSKYISILREEFINLPSEIREKLNTLSLLSVKSNTERMADTLERIENHLTAQEKVTNPPDSISKQRTSVTITFSLLPINRGFVGRNQELQLLSDELNNSPVVLIEGLPGIGKTSLAAKYINQQDTTIKSGAFWLECQDETQLAYILEAFSDFAQRNDDKQIEAAVQEERPLNDRLHTLVSILESRSSIFCIDGFEHADDSSILPLVEVFRDHCQKARLIICTRERPKSFFELLPDIGEVILGGLGIQEVAAVLNRLKISDEDGTTYTDVANKTEGHPLAIKLFSSLVRQYGFSVKELLNDSPEFGKSLEEHWLSKIYARLSSNERELLECFSIYAEPVLREGVHCVFVNPDWNTILQSVQDKFLISQASGNRFSMHSLIRDFCRRNSTEHGTLQRIAKLAAEYYLNKYNLQTYDINLSQDEVSDKLKAHHYLVIAQDYELASRVVHNIQHMLMKWSRFSQLLSLVEFSLETCPTSPAISWFQYYQARVFYIQGKSELSFAILEKLSKSAEQDVAAESIQMLATIYLDQKRTDEVISLFENNLAVFRRRSRSQQRIFDKVARVYIEKGEIDRAILIYNQILHWQEAEENQIGVAVTIRQLAAIFLVKNDFENAKNLLQLSLSIASEVGDQRLMARIANTFGELYEKSGVPIKAIESYEKALAIEIDTDQRTEIIPVAKKLINLYNEQGKTDRLPFLEEIINKMLTDLQIVSAK
jgi:tetratricopeptide (TPR) repeat protein